MRALAAYGILATFTVALAVVLLVGAIVLVPLALIYNFLVDA